MSLLYSHPFFLFQNHWNLHDQSADILFNTHYCVSRIYPGCTIQLSLNKPLITKLPYLASCLATHIFQNHLKNKKNLAFFAFRTVRIAEHAFSTLMTLLWSYIDPLLIVIYSLPLSFDSPVFLNQISKLYFLACTPAIATGEEVI